METKVTKLSEPKAKQTLSMPESNMTSGLFKAGEFLPELRGYRAINKYREMRDNSAVIGAVLYAVEQVLRDVEMKVVPCDKDNIKAVEEAEWVKTVFNDMEHTLDDHISEAVNFLWMGFSWFEVVYKRREGLVTRDPKKRSKYEDGRIGVRKIVSRAPWTLTKFEVDNKTGEVLGVNQKSGAVGKTNLIPSNKSLYYRTTAIDNDPSGRSILRNAYTSYSYLTNFQNIEGIAVEREFHGIPIGRIPAEYLAADATEDQKAFAAQMSKILADLKLNEQGYALLPSDLLLDNEGKSTGGVAARLVDIELISSQGNRNIDINPIIQRYQHDIARSVLSEFIMLGSDGAGSYALSKTKTDLFLRSLESYINTIADVLNKQLVEKLWELNGLPFETMPKVVAGDIAPHDLSQLSSMLRNMNGAEFDLTNQPDIVEAMLANAELPFDKTLYSSRLEEKKQEKVAEQEVKSKEVDNPKEEEE